MKRRSRSTKIPKLLSYVVPVLVGIGLFFAVRPRFEQIFAGEVNVSEFLVQGGDVEVDSETIEGYQQVYYLFEGRKTFVSEEVSLNSFQAHSRGEYIVWVMSVNGAGQVFRHHIPSGETVQITDSSSNGQPKVDRSGSVVWERWVWPDEEGGGDGSWQVFLFDGVSTRQITSGVASINPDLDGDRVVFASKSGRSWKAFEYLRPSRKLSEIRQGNDAKRPYFDKGQIRFEVELPVPTLPQDIHRGEPDGLPPARYEQSEGVQESTPSAIQPTMKPTPTVVDEKPTPTSRPSPNPTIVPSPTPTVPKTVSTEDVVQELTGEAEVVTPTPTSGEDGSSGEEVPTGL